MKIYKLVRYDAHEGALLSWHASKRDASRELARVNRARREEGNFDAAGPDSLTAIDIAPGRAGILAFLNAYFTTDNG